jgi:hypothetical protein
MRQWVFCSLLIGLFVVFESKAQIDYTEVDPKKVAHIEVQIWKSYYESKKLTLFWQSAKLLRSEGKVTFIRSVILAGLGAKAVYIFKKGQNYKDYCKALPHLKLFFEGLRKSKNLDFDSKQVAENEIEWWIIRRYRSQYPTEQWTHLQAKVASLIYSSHESDFVPYAKYRTEAMILRDSKDDTINEQDWKNIEDLLECAWGGAYQVVIEQTKTNLSKL